MFSKATANFIHQMDPEGSLIHVSRLNDSKKLVLMALVVKRNRFWYWQKPKYQPSDFTLGDLLLGDQPLSPAVSKTDFLTSYEGKIGDILSGKVDAKAGGVSVNLEGRGCSKLQSSFNNLKKEEVDVKRLLHDSNSRLVNMHHRLVRQLEKRAEVLAVLKERILTTSLCTVTQTYQQQGSCGWGILGKLRSDVEVCVQDNNNAQVDSDVSVEIPPGTVIAYSLLELEIKRDGHYEPCLQPGTQGGFETDEVSGVSSDSLCMVDGLKWCEEDQVQERAPLSALQNEFQKSEMYLSTLANLPELIRSGLFQSLREALKDRDTLSDLEHTLEEWCRGEAPVATELKEQASAVLDLLTPGPANHVENVPAHLTAAHLLVSAMEVLSDEVLSLLSECSPAILEAFNTLISRLKGSCRSLPIACLPVPLQDDHAFRLAEQLLSSANVTLRRDTDSLWAETGDKPGVLPLVLCIAVGGLSCLCHGQN